MLPNEFWDVLAAYKGDCISRHTGFSRTGQRVMSRDDDLYQLFSRQLRSQERLLWWGSPDILRVRQQRLFFAPTAPWAPFWGGVLLLLFVGTVQSAYGEVIPPWTAMFCWILACCVLIGAYTLSAFCSYRGRYRLEHTAYAVTDKRVFILAPGRKFTITSFGPADLGDIERVEYLDNWGDVLFGPRRAQCGLFRLRVHRQGFQAIPCLQQVAALLLDVQAQGQRREG